MSSITCYGKIPCEIASFLREGSLEWVQDAWDSIWDRASPERFVDSLINQHQIAFCGMSAGFEAMRLFSAHIQPLFYAMADAPLEREFLCGFSRSLRSKQRFICILPKFGKTSLGEKSFNGPAAQGIRMTQVLKVLGYTLESCPKKEFDALSKKIDSFVVELLMENLTPQILMDAEDMWHLGFVSRRSSLIHELFHIDHTLGDERSRVQRLNTFSWRWTTKEEEVTIERENRCLRARKERVRLSHKCINCKQVGQVEYSLLLGLDGLMKELCARHLAAPLNSPDRIKCQLEDLKRYAHAYLVDIPEDREIESEEIDRAFQKEARLRKNNALKLLVCALLDDFAENGCQQVRDLLTGIRRQTPSTRSDVFPFVKELLKMFSFGIGNRQIRS